MCNVCPLYIPLNCNVCPLHIPINCNVCPLYIPISCNVCPLYNPINCNVCPFFESFSLADLGALNPFENDSKVWKSVSKYISQQLTRTFAVLVNV